MQKRVDVNIIGAGLVGKILAKRILTTNCADIRSIMNGNIESSLLAVQNIGAGTATFKVAELYPADITFITTPDNIIKPAFFSIEKEKRFKKDSVVIHCSGVKPASFLKENTVSQVHIARAHPIKDIHSVEEALKNFKDIQFILEGDDKACEVANNLLNSLGAKILQIPKQRDCLYHSACVLATTFHQMLVCASSQLYENCGLDQNLALSLAKELAIASLREMDINAQYNDLIEGPIKRADAELIRENGKSILNDKILAIYKSLGSYAISLSNHKAIEKDDLLSLMCQI